MIFVGVIKCLGNVTVEDSRREYSKGKRFIIKYCCMFLVENSSFLCWVLVDTLQTGENSGFR